MRTPRLHVPFRAALGATLLALVAGAGAAAAAVPADLLDRPAEVSRHASQSVLLGIAKAGPARLVAIGERGIALFSDDGGREWRQAKVPVSVTLTALSFPSATQGWAVGHGGVVLRTQDSGESWVKQLDGKQAAAIEFEAAKLAAAAGDPSDPALSRRLRAAERLVAEGPDKPFLDVHFFDENHGLVVGAYGLIFATDDGGVRWRSLASEVDNRGGKHLYRICPAGEGVYLAGELGTLLRARTPQGGFDAVGTRYPGTFFGMLSSPSGTLIAYGLRGTVLRSSDSGVSWTAVDMGQEVSLTAGATLADGTLVLADETGRVLVSRDDGLHFTSVSVARPSAFTGIVQRADGGLILTGARGIAHVAANALSSEARP